ncbi:DNA polymerase III subunit gamma/tau [Thioalkalivibrio sp.]|uniref:DNA polymerase III subunit gamma/tau n=1 Tax=Thioalkalivibrio sp. TaxID=2093813 RepID=UPI0012D705AC|nr:DNA polymerase III subunit gamma/tau [Thioalkalivibrio sp.]TVP77805.1 MAG: DNA polymerase III subunit gamma/tau [Thioalkalivibrio sp.]
MSHQVLARKWRPGRFEDLIGQPHVVRALVNALTNDRLHHAYLFSGTRGVGKTTVARILARCLNCETGVTATPCGECRSCMEIAEGRHLDLIEVDAASRTRVDDTRELLDNVSYAPVSGRFKVYLIDEVHMLSEKSFNALLKTLEEPPPHVKFLLATTDPQKLPVTVLSRCLQFNLKPMSTALIAEHLNRVLAAEGIAAEPGALLRLAEAAEGSMRDALSLTDQAIAYGGAGLTEADICDMIGLLPRSRLSELLDNAWAGQGAGLLQTLNELDALAPDWSRLLEELAALVHGVAVEQAMALDSAAVEAGPASDPLVAWQRETARRQAPEEVQLAYQILLHGRRDLPHAPDPRIGVEMTLLRILAFRPEPPPREQVGGSAAGSGKRGSDRVRGTTIPEGAPASRRDATPSGGRASRAEPANPLPEPAAAPEPVPTSAPVAVSRPTSRPVHAVAEPRPLDWHVFANALQPGPVRELALHADLLEYDAERVVIAVQSAHRMLCTDRSRARLAEALGKILGGPVRLELRDQATASKNTPAARLAADAADRQARAESEVRADPVIAALRETFGAEVSRVHLRDEADSAGEGSRSRP